MDIQVHSCILLLEGTFVSAGHYGIDDICQSDVECEDVETIERHYVRLKCFSQTVIEQLKYLESMNALDELFDPAIGFNYFVGGLPEDSVSDGGYCTPSDSGRQHEADFTVTKVVGVFDNAPVGVHVEDTWPEATINEQALDEFVSALEVE